jgi:hypothetical protein
MEPKRGYAFTRWIVGLGLLGLISPSHAMPLLILPTGEITRVSYTGEEVFNDINGNGLLDTGDVLEGVAVAHRIQGATSGADFSGQLADVELTSHFRFSVIDHSSDFAHLEFGLLPGQFFNFYVGRGAAKNFDPSSPDAFARASDGELWLSIQPEFFFESVNNRKPDGTTLNRGWANIAVNNTGYILSDNLLRTLLEKNALHIAGGQSHGDHATQAIFDDHFQGLSPFFPQFTFNVLGEFNIFAVPEPSTWLLLLIGAGAGFRFRKPRRYSKQQHTV